MTSKNTEIFDVQNIVIQSIPEIQDQSLDNILNKDNNENDLLKDDREVILGHIREIESQGLLCLKATDEVLADYLAKNLAEISSISSEYVKQHIDMLNRKVDGIERAYHQSKQNITITPPTLEFVINNDMQIAYKQDLILVMLPFEYSPKTANGKKLKKEIVQRLKREVLIAFALRTYQLKHKLVSVNLINYDCSFFYHYHLAFRDNIGNFHYTATCFGSDYKIPSIINLEELPTIRDNLEHVLGNINIEEFNYGRKFGDLPTLSNSNFELGDSVVWKKI